MKHLGTLLLLLMLTSLSAFAQATSPMILDMVHHNPGEPRFITRYEDPAVMHEMGFNGKVYFLFDSPTLAIDWQKFDPDIFPTSSAERRWVDQKAAQIDAQHAACKAAGLKIYAMCDLVLFPKRLVEKYHLEKTYGNPRDPQTEKFLRLMIAQTFDRFPALDGLVVRIGETYLQDAPYHIGHIDKKGDADATIIPLIQILRDEICVKRRKQLIFRTWLSFDVNLQTYLKVSNAIEPHPNLIFSVKHCEGDFHRANAFSKIIGQGRHPQLIEVQCAREYEGKGAYPNYIANGVIEGFEEHRVSMPADALKSVSDFARNDAKFAGIWTWTRGGGWEGPFIKNELWPDLNAWVMAQWAADPRQSEESVFNRYATEKLGLKGDNVRKFRELMLTSAAAIVRGRASTHVGDISPWWTRDNGINRPNLARTPEARQRVLDQKDESVELWKKCVALSHEINFPDERTKDYVIVSTEYGLHLYRIYQAAFHLETLDKFGDRAQLKPWLKAYDDAWADYRALPSRSEQCADLYKEARASKSSDDGIDKAVAEWRKIAATQPSK